MKRLFLLLLITVLFGSAVNAQQITQQFSFSQNDVQISQSGEYDIVSLPETEFLQGEDNAGKPQLPVKHFKLLLPPDAVSNHASQRAFKPIPLLPPARLGRKSEKSLHLADARINTKNK